MLGVVVVFNNCTRSPTCNPCAAFVVTSASLPSNVEVPAQIPHPSVAVVNVYNGAVRCVTCRTFQPKNLVVTPPTLFISYALSSETSMLYNALSLVCATPPKSVISNVLITPPSDATLVPVSNPANVLNVALPRSKVVPVETICILFPLVDIVTSVLPAVVSAVCISATASALVVGTLNSAVDAA